MIKEIARRGRSVVWKDEHLTFKALEQGTFQFTNDVEYSINKGEWTSLAANTATPTMRKGDTIRWRATITPTSSAGVGTFSSTCDYNAMGNPLSLLLGDNFDDSTYTGAAYMHYRLFYNNTKLISAVNLRLVNLGKERNGIYKEMFYACSNLIGVCDLETNMIGGNGCYGMFQNCSSLVHAPYIRAVMGYGYTTLGSSPFAYMFDGCSSLLDIAAIPPTTKKQCSYAYYNMFRNCYNLVSIPALTIDASMGLVASEMFYGCTSLADASMITFTGSKGSYYSLSSMFYGCTSLVTPPASLPAGTYRNCFDRMFYGCSSMTASPELPAAALGNDVYYQMFRGCTNLNYIKCLATDISGSNCLTNWVNGVAATGTFVKHPDMNDWTTGVSGIPNGWTVLEAVQITVTYTGDNSGAYLKEIGGSEIIHTFIDGEPYEADLDDNKSYGVYDSNDNLVQTLSTPFSRTVSITI